MKRWKRMEGGHEPEHKWKHEIDLDRLEEVERDWEIANNRNYRK